MNLRSNVKIRYMINQNMTNQKNAKSEQWQIRSDQIWIWIRSMINQNISNQNSDKSDQFQIRIMTHQIYDKSERKKPQQGQISTMTNHNIGISQQWQIRSMINQNMTNQNGDKSSQIRIWQIWTMTNKNNSKSEQRQIRKMTNQNYDISEQWLGQIYFYYL